MTVTHYINCIFQKHVIPSVCKKWMAQISGVSGIALGLWNMHKDKDVVWQENWWSDAFKSNGAFIWSFFLLFFLTDPLQCEKLFQSKINKGGKGNFRLYNRYTCVWPSKIKICYQVTYLLRLFSLNYVFYTGLFLVGYFSVYNNTGRSGLVTPSIGDALAVKSGD